jgi:endonuclease I
MPMYRKIVSSRSGKVGKTYFYLENGYGIKMSKAQDKNFNLYPINVVTTSRKAMFLHVIVSLRNLKKCNDTSFSN